MGKSTVAAMFLAHGVPVFDADAEVRAMQARGGSLVPVIERAFPGSSGADGILRDKLGELVFNDRVALARLEAIVHPAVAERRAEFLRRHAAAPVVVFDIPLLFEKGTQDSVDAVVVVTAPEAVQRARVLARPSMSEEKLDRIIDLQMPDEEKRARADHIIETGGSLDDTERQVAALLDCLMQR